MDANLFQMQDLQIASFVGGGFTSVVVYTDDAQKF